MKTSSRIPIIGGNALSFRVWEMRAVSTAMLLLKKIDITNFCFFDLVESSDVMVIKDQEKDILK
jgi:hypothetical protein